MAEPPLLEVRDLRTHLALRRGTVRAVDGAWLTLGRGEALGLVGESGSGKSMLCHSVLRLEPRPAAAIVSGQILLDGVDLVRQPLARMPQVRGGRLGMILQDPLGALNPVLSIGDQIVESLRLASPQASRAELKERAAAALARVGIDGGQQRLRAYPFEFSGGMRQRVCAAIAVARKPAVLIADEPTTALDVTTQARFLDLLADLRSEFGLSLMLVTHDLGIVRRACDRVAVMYAGRIVEAGRTEELIRAPRHPYTEALLRALPHLDGPRLRRMVPIEGEPPSNATTPAPGCRFAARCVRAIARCHQEYPPRVLFAGGAEVSCWLHVPGEANPAAIAPAHRDRPAASPADHAEAGSAGSALLELVALGHAYRARRVQPGAVVAPALADVSLSVRPGESVGIAGESGSGKTTLARLILQLVAPSTGEIRFEGQPLTPRRMREYRRSVQAVFQDSAAALNGRMRIGELVAEPMQIQQPHLPPQEVTRRVEAVLQRVGLAAETRFSFPHELSGGQKQRVAIARALIIGPRLLVLDEPVSALDVSVRSQVLNLLLELKEQSNLTYLMIGHDLAVLRHVTDTLLVLYRGRVVEQGPTEQVLAAPAHPYTQVLVAASPRLDAADARVPEKSETAADAADGCAFAARCAHATAQCRQRRPLLLTVAGGAASGHHAACHLLREVR